MTDCGCFYCKQCLKDSERRDESCMICGNKKTRAFDLDDRHEVKSVENNLIDMKTYIDKGKKLVEVSPFLQLFYS